MKIAKPGKAALAAAIVGCLLVAGVTAPAQAQRIGTRAYADMVLNMHTRPNANAPITGVIRHGAEIRVDRCSGLWCNVRAGHRSGWVLRYALSFGEGPHALFWWDFL